MSFTRQDLMKFAKLVSFTILSVEDDSSDTSEVKILTLSEPVNATSSTTAGDQATVMSLRSNQVYVARENIDELLKGCVEKDGKIVYEGDMHLDVSKPSGRIIQGQYQVTKPSRIWLTKTKFSRLGNSSRQQQQTSFNSMITNMFGGGKVHDATQSTQGIKVGPAPTGTPENPTPVANKPVENHAGKETTEPAKTGKQG